jgi:hypothetical protein
LNEKDTNMTTPQTQYPEIKELAKFQMFAPYGDAQRRARLVWAIRDENPRISVFCNDPNLKGANGVITCAMDPVSFSIFIEKFKDICSGPIDKKDKVDCKKGIYGDDNKLKEIITSSELWFGKNAEGLVWISCIEKDKPRIQFVFNLSDYHQFYIDGKPIEKSLASTWVAEATINNIEKIYVSQWNNFKSFYVKKSTETEGTQKSVSISPDTFEDITF